LLSLVEVVGDLVLVEVEVLVVLELDLVSL
jgi:hypothetical protein